MKMLCKSKALIVMLVIFHVMLPKKSAVVCILSRFIFFFTQVVPSLASNYPAGSAPGAGSSGPFSWVPRQMLSGDAAEEEGESEGESDGGEEERGEGDEAELVIDIPNE